MMTHDPSHIDERVALPHWPVPEVPGDFAMRVASRWQDERARTHRSHGWWRGVLAFAVVCVVTWLVAHAPTPAREGTAVATVRTEVAVDERAQAVLEAGARLRWTRDGAGLSVAQEKGAVFYRVDKGSEAFEVHTLAGDVVVLGTCFTVELIAEEPRVKEPTMKRQTWAMGAASTAVAAIAVVTVYEGRVSLRNAQGEAAIGAGEQAVMQAGHAPRSRQPVADDEKGAKADQGAMRAQLSHQARTIETLRAEAGRYREHATLLEQEIAELEDRGLTPKDRAIECAQGGAIDPVDGSDTCAFLEPEQETLLEMARCSTVKDDIPSVLGPNGERDAEDPKWFEQYNATPQEHAGFRRAAERFLDDRRQQLEAIFVETGGSKAALDDIPMSVLSAWVEARVGVEKTRDAMRRLAYTRAGLANDEEKSTLEDRYVRLRHAVGDGFERYLAEEIGAERARALRAANDGWPGGRSTWSGDCDDEVHPE